MSGLDTNKIVELFSEIQGCMQGAVVKMSANRETLLWLRSQFPQSKSEAPLLSMPLYELKDLPFGVVEMEYGSGRKEAVIVTVGGE